MQILPLPASLTVTHALTDRATGHPELVRRVSYFELRLAKRGMRFREIEWYRYDARQAFLFGQGRDIATLLAHGLDPKLAQPQLPIVTDAWSAAVGAHGWTRQDETGTWIPAAAALDIVPVGADGNPWTKDDPWDDFLACCAEEATPAGLVHFRRHGLITDRPHLQLIEWNDALQRLDPIVAPPPLAA